MKPTKQKLYANLTASNTIEGKIINESGNLRELKTNIIEYLNKFKTLESQQNKSVRYYLGNRFLYTDELIAKYLKAGYNLALKMNYKIIEQNGFHFIETK